MTTKRIRQRPRPLTLDRSEYMSAVRALEALERKQFVDVLKELVRSATPFARQTGTRREKALWADVKWANELLIRTGHGKA